MQGCPKDPHPDDNSDLKANTVQVSPSYQNCEGQVEGLVLRYIPAQAHPMLCVFQVQGLSALPSTALNNKPFRPSSVAGTVATDVSHENDIYFPGVVRLEDAAYNTLR